ncbi:MAG: DUF2273 domain-containing protein [Limnochordaceae bacterium]|nr:DUF2273 domain-containing protein [Limnochordaceae bacterium]
MYDDEPGRADCSWWEALWTHRGKLAGAALGLLWGLLVLHYGLGRTLFLTLLTVAGYWLGGRWDEAQQWWQTIRRRLGPRSLS